MLDPRPGPRNRPALGRARDPRAGLRHRRERRPAVTTAQAPTLADLEAARARIDGIAQVAVYPSETLSRLAGRPVQLRGGEPAAHRRVQDPRRRQHDPFPLTPPGHGSGVVAASAGNHGQAVAWAAREAGIAATGVHAARLADGEGGRDAKLRRERRACRRRLRRVAHGRAGVRRRDRRHLHPRL